MFYEKYIKRFFDIVLCSIALVGLSPLLLVTAIAIKVSSPGPVFYHSDRVGKNGKIFHFYKFRSMHVTDKDKHLCVVDSERVFPFGKFIRKAKIDELPQLINVIKGDMSIVGPRPMTPASKMYDGEFSIVRSIRPGLTSAASLFDYVVGDTYTDNTLYKKEVYPIKQKLELFYVNNRCFEYDTKLVFRTIILIIAIIMGKRKITMIPELKKIDVYCKGI